jgi:transcriptional regulator of acetoin/glycerol metabolism
VSGGKNCELTEIARQSPEEVEAHFRMLLTRARGKVAAAARLAGVSRPYFWWLMKRRNLGHLPGEVRRHLNDRFRLPPL